MKNINGIKELLFNLHDSLGGTCYLCRCDLSEEELSKDHVFPKSSGFSIVGNIMPAHIKCNSDKGDRNPTLEELELTCETYEKLGISFSSRMIRDFEVTTKPLSFFINQLKM